MSVTHMTTASFRHQQAIGAERNRITSIGLTAFSMGTIRDVGAILAEATKGASALYLSFASLTKFGPARVSEAAVAAKQGRRPLFTYLRPQLPDSELDISSPAVQDFLAILPHVDVLELSSDEVLFFAPTSFDFDDAMLQLCQLFNLKALVVFDAKTGGGLVATREMNEPVPFNCAPSRLGNVEETEGSPSRFGQLVIYSFLERGGVQAVLSPREVLSIVRESATSAASWMPDRMN